MNQKINVAILGAGRIAYVHAKAMQQNLAYVTIKYVIDPFITPATEAKFAGFKVGCFAKDVTLAFNDPTVDVIYICTPTPTHATYCIQALEHNKHVFCEKPISLDLSEIQAIAAKLAQTNCKFAVGHNRRFDHNFQAIKQAISNDTIGPVYQIKITSRDPNLPPLNYLTTAGNLFYDMMIHDLDMARFLSKSPIKSVYATGSRLINPALNQLNDLDTAVVVLVCQDDSMIIIDNCRQSNYGYDQRIEILGAKGQLQIGNDTASTLITSTAVGVVSEKPLDFFLERYMQAYVAETVSFLEAIKNNTAPLVSLADGLQAILLAAAATLSWKENRIIDFETFVNANS